MPTPRTARAALFPVDEDWVRNRHRVITAAAPDPNQTIEMLFLYEVVLRTIAQDPFEAQALARAALGIKEFP